MQMGRGGAGIGHPLLMSPFQVHATTADKELVGLLCAVNDAPGRMQNVSSL